MNRLIQPAIRHLALILAFSLVVVFGCTCVAPKKATPDPLAGWIPDYNRQTNQSIINDYQDYLHKLPLKKTDFAGSVEFFIDGQGQHAIRIGVGIDGTWWDHVLFYDINGKRVKVVKYKSGGYQS